MKRANDLNAAVTKKLIIAQIPLGSSRHVSTRVDTFDVSSPRILAVSSLSNGTARRDELDWLDLLTRRDEPSGIWANLEFRGHAPDASPLGYGAPTSTGCEGAMARGMELFLRNSRKDVETHCDS